MSSEHGTTGVLRHKFALLSLIVLVALAAVAGATQQSAKADVCGAVSADVGTDEANGNNDATDEGAGSQKADAGDEDSCVEGDQAAEQEGPVDTDPAVNDGDTDEPFNDNDDGEAGDPEPSAASNGPAGTDAM